MIWGEKTEARCAGRQWDASCGVSVLPTPKNDYEGTIATIVQLVQELEASYGQSVERLVWGFRARLWLRRDSVKNANSTWLNGQTLGLDLSSALGREVRCANDANCFAISEAIDGAAKGYEVVFGVILGTGCGGGVAIQRQGS